MPSQKDLWSWIKNDSAFKLEGGDLFCLLCGRKVTCPKKFLLDQHKRTKEHRDKVDAARDGKLHKQQSITAGFEKQQKSGNLERSQFNEDLCKTLLKADIPLNKLENEHVRSFLEKYTGQKVPSSSSLRKSYVTSTYNSVIEQIREDIGESPIWISADETADACGRYIVHVLVGKLSKDERGKPHLIMCKELKSVKHDTIARAVDDALRILWPTRNIAKDRVLAFVSDAGEGSSGPSNFLPEDDSHNMSGSWTSPCSRKAARTHA